MRIRLGQVPYKLSEHGGMVCAMGGDTVLRTLMRLDGSRIRYHDPLGKYIAFPATREGIMAAEAIAAPSFVSPEYVALRAKTMSVEDVALDMWRARSPWLKRPLMRHQEEFCAIALERRGMFNGSEQGTGKTATIICLAAAWKPKLTVIVTPKSIVSQWHAEWFETVVTPDTAVLPLIDRPIEERAALIQGLVTGHHGPVVVIINYEALYGITDVMKTINLMFNHCKEEDVAKLGARPAIVSAFDEAWKIKSPRARVTKAAFEIADMSEHVLLATGTPVGQGVCDLRSQIRAIQGEAGMETEKEWSDWYERIIFIETERGKSKKSSGCKDPIALMRRMAPYFYRATKATCLDLPEKLPTRRIKMEMPPDMAEVYKAVKEDGEAALGDGLSLAGERSTALRLQQILGGFVFNADGSYDDEEVTGQRHDMRLRLIHSPKMQWLKDFAEDQLSGDATYRCIIWCKFNAEVEHITSRLRTILGDDRVMPVTGKTNDGEVEEIKKSFNSRDPEGVQVVVGQFKKLAYGHNMQAGDVNVYYSHTWSHVEKSQSADRTHRYGRTAPVAYIELVMTKPRGVKWMTTSIDEAVLASTDNLQDMQDRLAPHTVGGKQ